MRNIHLLPTDKPSRLWINNLLQRKLELSTEVLIGSNTAQHIYITSDEEIKEGEYQLYNPISNFNNAKVSKAKRLLKNDGRRKKIILTTDQDLIKNGIQAIDDEFLEWFVKNPTCEFVKIVDDVECLPMPNIHINKHIYKIIIPKEEPKLETLEEAALNHQRGGYEWQNEKRKSFTAGAKWQAERMYSEEQMKQSYSEGASVVLRYYDKKPFIDKNEWFEQFKKK